MSNLRITVVTGGVVQRLWLVPALLFIIIALFSLSAAPIAEGKSKFLGNIFGSSIPSDFSDYWNQVTPENAGKWGNVERVRDSMNWTSLKNAYDFAQKNGYPFKQHTFVWGQQEPSWIDSVSPEEQKEELEEFIRLFAENFPKTDFADVVNEPLNAPASYRQALGGDGATGWDWVVWVFEKARQYLPNTKLLINEWGIVNSPQMTDKYLEIINILKGKNLVDGIGVQSHCFNLQETTPEIIKSNLDKLASTGLPVYSSEFDLQGDDALQKQRYEQYFPVFWEHTGVKGITLWGYRFKRTWKETTWLKDSTGGDRPALHWLRSYVSTNNSIEFKNVSAFKKNPIITYDGDGYINIYTDDPVFLELFTLQGKKVSSCLISDYRRFPLTSFNSTNGMFILRVNRTQVTRIKIIR